MLQTRLFAALLIIFVVIGFDQATKWIAWENFYGNTVTVLPFLNFVLIINKGIAFGMLEGIVTNEVIIAASSFMVIVLTFIMLKSERTAVSFALSLVIGGAISNIIDRMRTVDNFRLEGVIDFLDFHFAGWHYPAFNIADACIVIGVLFLIYDLIYLEPKDKRKQNEKDEY